MPRMDKIDLALAEEVRREIAGRGLTAKAVCAAVGISQSSYHNYFTAPKRALKLRQIVGLADLFGMEPEQLIRQARARAGTMDGDLEALLTPNAREGVERGRAEVRREAAEEEAQDPPDAANGRRRSA
jgi:transcriptional regulator with XRE-family HTH domain